VTPTIEHIFIYPIKSMGGVSVLQAAATDRGLAHDRRWMLVDQNGRFITQREEPSMCFFSVEKSANGMLVRTSGALDGCGDLSLPWSMDEGNLIKVSIWSDQCSAIEASVDVNQFFSNAMKRDCRLVYMPEASERPIDLTYSRSPALAAFGDGYPVLLIGTASLGDLNERLEKVKSPTLQWDRFRPNVVVRTSVAYDEDYWASFELGSLSARGVKLCSRCVFTTIDQLTGVSAAEPLRTLATYRMMNNRVMFGQHVILNAAQGGIHVGDEVLIHARNLPPNAGS